MKASLGTWLRLHHFAKVLFVSIASPADGGHGEQAGYMTMDIFFNEFQLVLLSFLLQECYYIYQNHKLKPNQWH